MLLLDGLRLCICNSQLSSDPVFPYCFGHEGTCRWLSVINIYNFPAFEEGPTKTLYLFHWELVYPCRVLNYQTELLSTQVVLVPQLVISANFHRGVWDFDSLTRRYHKGKVGPWWTTLFAWGLWSFLTQYTAPEFLGGIVATGMIVKCRMWHSVLARLLFCVNPSNTFRHLMFCVTHKSRAGLCCIFCAIP